MLKASGNWAPSQSPAAKLQRTSYQTPRFRWWWPGGWIDAGEVVNEITAIVSAGFGGGEIGDVQDSIKDPTLDPKIYGWAQPRWDDAVYAAYQRAAEIGGHVDMTLGPHWPTGFPGYTPDSPSTSKELVHGQTFVSAGQTFSGPLPLPVAAPSGNETGNPNVKATPILAAVLVARTTTTNTSSSVVDFDPSTVQVITNQVIRGRLTWTAPSNGTYIIVAAYGRGTGQIQNMYDGNPEAPKLTYPFPAYIVDHFSPAGVEAGVKYWDEHILSARLRPLLPEVEGSIFEDSLELKVKQYWTLNFLQEFQTRRGYDLSPFILYVLQDTNTFVGDDVIANQIINDFYQTVSDLYIGYRLEGLKAWANSIGMKLRVQPYTISADSCYAASVLDIPEGESLGFEGDNDAFRVLATGRDIGGKTTILSDELGAYMGEAYGVTWKFIIGTANLDMSLGVSQVVIHGFPYRDSPTSLWPGYAPFTPLGTSSNGFADAWGPRQPQWLFANNASTYLANAQKLLQDGGPSIDIAILNTDWGVTASWSDTGLNDAGYSYQFPTSELLSKYNVQVANKILAPEGPAYKALLLNQSSLDVSSAQTILSYGEAGLPIVLYGSTPTQTFSYSANEAAAVQQLQGIVSQIQSLSTTKTVSEESEVPAALQALDIQPSVQYPAGVNNTLITYRKTYGQDYLYWIYNDGDSDVSEVVQLAGSGQPYTIDLWGSTVSPIAAYSSADGYTAVNVSIPATAVQAIYLGNSNPFGAPTLSSHVTATDCDSYVQDSTIYLVTNTSCSATVSTGQDVSVSASNLPATVTPSSWSLVVKDWAPAIANATGLQSSLTTTTYLPAVNLSTLLPWTNITSLEYASGVGFYTTNVNLPTPSNTSTTRIYLSIGNVEGTYGVSINGQVIDVVDQFGRPIDVTDSVKSGDNELIVTVATTLWNKLRLTWPAIYGDLTAQAIGLTGPVTFQYMHVEQI